MLLKGNNVRRVREIRGKKTRSEGLVCHILAGLSQLPVIPSLQNPPKNNALGCLSLFIPLEWALFGERLAFLHSSHFSQDNTVGWILSLME